MPFKITQHIIHDENFTVREYAEKDGNRLILLEQYNPIGFITFRTDGEDNWEKWVYNENDKLVSFDAKDGRWERYEYQSNPPYFRKQKITNEKYQYYDDYERITFVYYKPKMWVKQIHGLAIPTIIDGQTENIITFETITSESEDIWTYNFINTINTTHYWASYKDYNRRIDENGTIHLTSKNKSL